MRSPKSSLLIVTVALLVAAPAFAQVVVVQPKAVEQPEPTYPLAAKAAGVEGAVRFRVTISAAGRVDRVEIVSVPEPGLGFEEAVIESVSRWRFSPATVRGNPVASEYAGTLQFTLNLPGQAILSSSSKDTWRAVREMLRQLKVPVDKADDTNQTVTSGRARYAALPLPPAEALGLPAGFRPERLILHIYVTPGMEPARVSVGSILEVEPIASNDVRHFLAYGLDVIGRWFLEELSRRMSTRMEILSASAERRAAQARELMPAGLVDPCATAPAPFLDRQTRTATNVSFPKKLYDVRPNYPKDQLEANRTAQIVFRGEITEHGTLINPTMTEPANAPASFITAAQLAFGLWRFAPGLVKGCPARMEGSFQSTFTLK